MSYKVAVKENVQVLKAGLGRRQYAHVKIYINLRINC